MAGIMSRHHLISILIGEPVKVKGICIWPEPLAVVREAGWPYDRSPLWFHAPLRWARTTFGPHQKIKNLKIINSYLFFAMALD
jgi:hypothetical protein